MSSTSRGAERRNLDAYYTPDDVAQRLVSLLPIACGAIVLEPSVGGGAFARALHPVADNVWGMDINEDAPGLNECTSSRVGDFFDMHLLECEQRPMWIVGNPPFTGAEEHARHALSITGRHVAFLLRLAFLESATRAPFWTAHPPRRVWVFSKRPSFTGGKTDSCAYGFFWWDREYRGEPALGWV